MDRTSLISFFPKESDHLPEGTNAEPTLSCLPDNASDDLKEALRLRYSINHELRQSLDCIQRDVLTPRVGGDQIQSFCLQSFFKSLSVCFRGYNDAGITRTETCVDKSTQ